MECKEYSPSCAQSLSSRVLIETLWNVKKTEPADDNAPVSINRNIVECKGIFVDKLAQEGIQY